MMKNILLNRMAALLLLLVITLTSKAQQPATGNKSVLTGTLTDSSEHKPLPYVTVGLFRKNNFAQAIKTVYTDSKGKFRVTAPDTGIYTIVYTHSGFGEIKQGIRVTGSKDLGEIFMNKKPVTLKDVTIMVQKPLVEQSDDKVTYNVENDADSKGSTTIDIFRKTPFLSVDGDDNVQLNGQGNFKVLLNGRETSMFAKNLKEALRGFPATLISKIEIITNPPAKYDAEGIGGVINIITKKKVAGYNGSVNTFNRTGNKANNASVNLNGKSGKVGFAAFYFFNISNKVTSWNNNQTVALVPSYFTKRTVSDVGENDNFYNAGNGEISIEIDSFRTLSMYGNLEGGNGKNKFDRTIATDYPSLPSSVSMQFLNTKYAHPSRNFGTDFIRKYRRPEKEFSIRFFGEFGKGEEDFNSYQDNPGSDRFIINENETKNNQFTLQSDYILPLAKNKKLETGMKGIFRSASSDFQSYYKYDPADQYKLDAGNSDHFKYRQQVGSVYGSYNIRGKKTTFRLGGRLEYTHVKGDFISTATKVDQSYANFIPNLQSTTKLNQVITLIIGYTQRLQRPYIWNLNPFVNNIDSSEISYGNPKLGPQILHVPSVTARFQKKATFVNLGLQGFFTNNYISDVSTFDPTTGITSRTSANAGKGYQINFFGNLNSTINKWNVGINGSAQYNNTHNKLIKGQDSEGFGYNFGTNISYKITPKVTASTFFNVNQQPAVMQRTFPLNVWYNAIMTFKLFKDKITTSIRAVNFLTPKRDFKTIIEDNYFRTTQVATRIMRGYVLTVNYNFGKLKENVSKKKGVNNDDLLNNNNTNNSGGN